MTWSLGFGHPSRYEPRSTELNFGEQTGTGVFQTWSLGFGHPSRNEPRSTGLNFVEQTGTGVFPREQSLIVLLYILLIYPENFSNILNSIGHQTFKLDVLKYNRKRLLGTSSPWHRV